ncbi:hypothetical protein UFOVP397_41 [uncultured Caudovirales phage]|uniref:Uncharacterized protein n=1 Tax=uncultured Caudovirales phage TaxID=2100421 RepID=A0A6J5LZJ0_9CAUD|nr:hypothetical protein UFOVP397_41 [uncultured Caudovirales phage]
MVRLRPQSRAIYEAIVDELQKQGVRDHVLTMRSKHPAVQFVVGDQTRVVTFAGSPGDNLRSALNQRRWVRQIIQGRGPFQGGVAQ